MIKFTGKIVQVNKETSLQFFENTEGDFLSIHTEDGRLIVVPVSAIEEALESQWARDSSDRSKRYLSVG